MNRLEGRVAVITGAATGIGAATAKRLAADGASVAIGDVNLEEAEKVVAGIQERGGTARALQVDVSEEDAVAELIASTRERYGRIDILHNNAAAVSPDVQGRDGAVVDGEVEVWDRTMAVNLRGVMLGCKYAIPHMLEVGAGVIVNTSSMSALGGGPRAVAYGASKSGIISVTKHVAARYGKQGVRAIAIAPGLVVSDRMGDPHGSPWMEAMLRQQCTEHVGRPEDVANLVSFLASDEAAFITGIVIPIDGGAASHRASLVDELELLGVTGEAAG